MGLVGNMLTVLVLFLGCVYIVHAEITCAATDDGIMQYYTDCFQKQGLELAFPTFSSTDASVNKQNFLEAYFRNRMDTTCSDKDKYTAALKCVMTYAIACAPSELKGFLPSPDNIGKILDTMCSNEEKVNLQCADDKASALYDCGVRKGTEIAKQTNQNTKPEEIFCKAYQAGIDCVLEELPSCGCRTLRAYYKMSAEYFYPPACTKTQRLAVLCDAADDAKITIGDNGHRHVGSTLVYIASSIILLVNIFTIYF